VGGSAACFVMTNFLAQPILQRQWGRLCKSRYKTCTTAGTATHYPAKLKDGFRIMLRLLYTASERVAKSRSTSKNKAGLCGWFYWLVVFYV
jgi:hypothetical protein